jgi:hypothetical protein
MKNIKGNKCKYMDSRAFLGGQRNYMTFFTIWRPLYAVAKAEIPS